MDVIRTKLLVNQIEIMKNIIFISTILISLGLQAQSPQSFKYQAVVRDANFQAIPNTAVSIMINIFSDSCSGNSVFRETFSATTNDYGLVNLNIGEGVQISSSSFSSINWSTGSYFIESALDLAGTGNHTFMTCNKLRSVPYAMFAEGAPDDQQLSLVGDSLILEDGGSIDLSAYNNNYWNRSNNKLYNVNLTDLVGVGTSNPVSNFHVNGSPTLGQITISPNESGSGDDAQIMLAEDNDATYGMTLNYDGGDNNFYISGKSQNSVFGPHLTIERNSGDIGMGTTSPTSTLHVNGDFRLEDGTQGANKVLISDANGNASWGDAPDDGDWVQLDLDNDGIPDQLWKNSVPVGIGWQYATGNVDKLKFAVEGDGNFDGDHVVAIRNDGNDWQSGRGEDVLFLQIMNTDANGSGTNPDGYVAGRNNFITFAGPYNFNTGNYVRYGRIEGVAPNPNLAALATSDPCMAKTLGYSATDPVGNSVQAGCLSNGGIVYASGNGDYAEWLEMENVNEEILKTDIVGVRGGKISKNTTNAEQIMVVSTSPIVLGAEPSTDKIESFRQVAFMGQVPVKIKGDVTSGDYILPSGENDGFAIAVGPENLKIDDLSNIIGRSWSTVKDREYSLVNIVVGVKTHEWTQIYKVLQNDLLKLESNLDLKMDQLNDRLKTIESFIYQQARNNQK